MARRSMSFRTLYDINNCLLFILCVLRMKIFALVCCVCEAGSFTSAIVQEHGATWIAVYAPAPPTVRRSILMVG